MEPQEAEADPEVDRAPTHEAPRPRGEVRVAVVGERTPGKEKHGGGKRRAREETKVQVGEGWRTRMRRMEARAEAAELERDRLREKAKMARHVGRQLSKNEADKRRAELEVDMRVRQREYEEKIADLERRLAEQEAELRQAEQKGEGVKRRVSELTQEHCGLVDMYRAKEAELSRVAAVVQQQEERGAEQAQEGERKVAGLEQKLAECEAELQRTQEEGQRAAAGQREEQGTESSEVQMGVLRSRLADCEAELAAVKTDAAAGAHVIELVRRTPGGGELVDQIVMQWDQGYQGMPRGPRTFEVECQEGPKGQRCWRGKVLEIGEFGMRVSADGGEELRLPWSRVVDFDGCYGDRYNVKYVRADGSKETWRCRGEQGLSTQMEHTALCWGGACLLKEALRPQ